MPHPEPIDVVRDFLRALDERRIDDALGLLADDFVLTQAPSLPYGGTWRGRDGVRTFFARVFETWSRFGSRDVRLFADGDTVVMLATAIGSTRDGREFEMPMAQAYTVGAGRIVSARPFYFDTAALASLAAGAS